MGQAKKYMMDNEVNNDLVDFLQELSIRGVLEEPLSGIAKQAISKGIGSLSDKQKKVVDKFERNYKEKNLCEACLGGNMAGLTDYIRVADNGGLCLICQQGMDRIMEE